MDLDEQELKATRKLHRLDKYDDTDYLINREESIEYKISDTNDDSIKEDIMSEEAFNELIDNFEEVETLTEYGRKAIKQNVKKLQKRIKELEEENGILEFQNKQVENCVKELKKYNKTVSDRIVEYKKNSIPKQKIKDKIEELNKQEQELQNSISEEERKEYSDTNISFQLCDIEIRREVLQEFLLESEDK